MINKMFIAIAGLFTLFTVTISYGMDTGIPLLTATNEITEDGPTPSEVALFYDFRDAEDGYTPDVGRMLECNRFEQVVNLYPDLAARMILNSPENALKMCMEYTETLALNKEAKEALALLSELILECRGIRPVVKTIQAATNPLNLEFRDVLFNSMRRRGQVKALTNKSLMIPNDNPQADAMNDDTCKRVAATLSASIKEDDTESVKLLLNAYRNATSCGGAYVINKEMSLINAIGQGSKNTAKLLLKEKPDLSLDLGDDSPLILAAHKGFADIADLLLKNGASVDLQTLKRARVTTLSHRGVTALMIASNNKDVDLVKLLLKYKANVHIRDRSGLVARDYANKGYADNEEKRATIVKLLKKSSDGNINTCSEENTLSTADYQRIGI